MKKFCENCLKEVECNYYEEDRTIFIENHQIDYLKKYYVCSECGKEFLDDLYDYDIETVNNKLRILNNIITTGEIEMILKKYDIGKKPLSLILGIGEINIIRYLDGANPTKEISDLLKMILKNPFLYELYLQANKDKITKIAYKKSLSKVKQLELSSSNSKLYNSALYVLKSLDEVDALSIQKTLYFANGFSKFFLSNRLFNDSPEAWIHGPVYREIYDCFSYYQNNKMDYSDFISDIEIDLTNEEKDYLDVIINDFCCYSGSLLRKMTHLTAPWMNARVGLEDETYSNRIIDLEDMDNYFYSVYKNYNMRSVNDISKYSTKLFNEARKVRKAI